MTAEGVVLSVVVPVLNQADSIVENIEVIRRSLEEGLDGAFELVVVSDGSIDATAERILEARGDRVRTLHYDRNLGKGYAVKTGAREARGRWIAFIDGDLDLHPSRLPELLRAAQEHDLDFAIGSKRHPESRVLYPRSRVVASWLYQQLVRLLFDLDVRDTQVGLKVFRREVAEEVMPLLLVKRYAFDLELLAVARALGFRRVEELPVTLDYRFTGSGVRSLAVLHALVDTAAIAYRLRVLHTYQRKRRLLDEGLRRVGDWTPTVAIVTERSAQLPELDWEGADVVVVDAVDMPHVREAALGTPADVIAVLGRGVRPAGNWLAATVPYLAQPEIGAVVAPKLAPATGSVRERGAAAVSESRFGGGGRYFRYTPGNLRVVDEFPDDTIVIRRDALLAVGDDTELDEMCGRLTADGIKAVYTPETVLAGAPAPLFRPRFGEARRYGHRRGSHVRSGHGRLRATTVLPVALLLFLALAPAAAAVGWVGIEVWLGAATVYGLVLTAIGVLAAVKFRSLAVGVVTIAGLLGTHVAFGIGFVRGLVQG